MREIKGVIFDMDGVITDSETYARLAMKKVFKDRDIPWDEDYYNSLLGVTNLEGDILTTKKFNGDSEFAITIMNEFKENLTNSFKNHEVGFKPGAMELIQFLNEHNFPIALATSASDEKLHLSFESNSIEIPFKHIVNGPMVTKCKPDPEIFLKAADKLGLDIKDCMVIEDSSKGIEAAIACGSIATLVPDYILPPQHLIDQATYVKKDLFEVLEIVKQYVIL